jgi:enamine deaminase RidA (YjgF/YER057c/UK114 family)
MQVRLFSWLGRDFVEIVGEGQSGLAADIAMRQLFGRFEAELKSHGLSLDDVVRVCVWGRDRDARTPATATRSKILTGQRKAASSSFISEQWFDSDANAGLELLAMKPGNGSPERRPVEFEPPRNYLCYLRYDSVLFFSGFTSDAATLEEQIPDVIRALASAFTIAGTDCGKVVKLSIFYQQRQKIEAIKELLAKGPKWDVPEMEFIPVDGFAGEKYLVEIEATALSGEGRHGRFAEQDRNASRTLE